MPIHRFEAAFEDGTLLDLIPVVNQQAIFYGAGDFLLATGDHLLLVAIDGLGKRTGAVRYTPEPCNKV